MSDFDFNQVNRLFAAQDLPGLYNYISEDGERRGEKQERQRIIELLEDPATLQAWFTKTENYQSSNFCKFLIALIKEENK